MAVFDWPYDADLDPKGGIAFNLRGQTAGGPVSLGGFSQVVQHSGAYWVATLGGVQVKEGARTKLFRALRSRQKGGAHQVRVPVFDEGQQPWPGAAEAPAEVTFDDDVGFDDDAPFQQPTIGIVAGAAAAAGDTSMTLTALTSATLTGGEYFSIGDRLYLIEAVLSISGADYTVAIDPPLREGIADGAELNFDRPVCKMRLMSEAEMDLTLGRLWQGRADVGFIEVF